MLKSSKLMRERMILKSYDTRFFKTKMMAQLYQACANDSATEGCEEVKFTDFVLVFRTHAGENSHRYGDRKHPLDAWNGTGKYHPPMELDELYRMTP